MFACQYLKSEDDIVDYFKDCGAEFLHCTQGEYEDCKVIEVQIGSKYFEVTLHAEIGSAKQDRGDRLYWVEDITDVGYIQISGEEIKERQLNESFRRIAALQDTLTDEIDVLKGLL